MMEAFEDVSQLSHLRSNVNQGNFRWLVYHPSAYWMTLRWA